MPKPKKKTRKPATKKAAARKPSTIARELAAMPDAADATPLEASPKTIAPTPRIEPTMAANAPLRLEWRSPQELAENPANWRRHPPEQVGALSGVIAEVGWAGACLFNEATGRLIDGHARRKVAIERDETKVPVLIGSWTEEQERKILVSLDPLSAMAVADPAALASLLSQVDTECAELQAMLDALAVASPVEPEPTQPKDAKKVEHVCPSCGCRFAGGQLIAGEES